jgi:hypothetical protein
MVRRWDAKATTVLRVANITIVTCNFFHPKRGSTPVCFVSCLCLVPIHPFLLSGTRLSSSFLLLYRYPSRSFCLAATSRRSTIRLKNQVPYSVVASVSTSRLACVSTRASHFVRVKLRLDHLSIFLFCLPMFHLTTTADIVAYL